MAMWLSKFFKRSTNSGKVKITGKRVSRGGGFGLELPTLRGVVSPPVASVATCGETIAGRAGAAREYILQGGTFSCIWLRQKLMKEGFVVCS